MHPLITFLLKSIFISALLYGYYLAFLRNRKMHSFNRFYLLSLIAGSIIIPMLHFQLHTPAGTLMGTSVKLLQAINVPDEQEIVQHSTISFFTVENCIIMAYALTALAILSVAIYKVVWVYKLKSKSDIASKWHITIVSTDNSKAPFSFFNLLFWRSSIDMESAEGRRVLQHEMAHITQLHTLDKLFMQLVLVMFWANPIYWLVQKELSQVQEFIADQAAIEDGDTSALAAMLLQCHYGNIAPHIVNGFFYSSIKRRIIMLNQNKTKYAKARRLLALPLLAAAAILCSCKVTENSVPVNVAKEKITMVLDAGHGGDDPGAIGMGVMEKDLNLRVCDKIEALAREYNVNIVRTRKDDKYIVLANRSDMANKANADLLVSIHINKNAPDNPVTSGYEVIASEKSPQFEQSKLLASAIIGGMKKDGIAPEFVNKGIFMLKNSNIPAVTIECGRIDNMSELAVLQNDAKLESLCRNILSGVVAYENLVKK